MCRAYRLAQVFVTMSISWGVGLGLILTAEVFYIAMYSRWSSQLFLIWALRLLIVLPMLSVRPHPTWMGWDGMGRDGMGWDGMGRDGMGWDGTLCFIKPTATPHAAAPVSLSTAAANHARRLVSVCGTRPALAA